MTADVLLAMSTCHAVNSLARNLPRIKLFRWPIPAPPLGRDALPESTHTGLAARENLRKNQNPFTAEVAEDAEGNQYPFFSVLVSSASSVSSAVNRFLAFFLTFGRTARSTLRHARNHSRIPLPKFLLCGSAALREVFPRVQTFQTVHALSSGS